MTDRRCFDGGAFGPILAMAALVGGAAPAHAQPADLAHGSRGGAAAHSPGAATPIEVEVGQVITVGTCGVPGARHAGDTTIALIDPEGVQVGFSDDACGGLGSRLVHHAAQSGTYRVVAGCYSGSSCGGRLAWRVGEEEASAPPVELSTGLNARVLLGPDGQGLVADAWLATRIDAAGGLVLRLSGAPMGIAGGREGGVLGGSLQLTVGWDLDFVELGLGGGVSTLSRRGQGLTDREIGVLALRARFGTEHDFHVAGQFMLGFLPDDEMDATLDVSAVLPIDAVEILARGVYGMSGVWLGEVGVVWWPEGAGRGGVGLAFLAGGAAVTYQPVCRFGLVCEATTYAGPHVGLGIHVRP